jgi:hypothetical protein
MDKGCNELGSYLAGNTLLFPYKDLPVRKVITCHCKSDRLCGLVVTVPDYISRGPRFDFRRYQIF